MFISSIAELLGHNVPDGGPAALLMQVSGCHHGERVDDIQENPTSCRSSRQECHVSVTVWLQPELPELSKH